MKGSDENNVPAQNGENESDARNHIENSVCICC